MMARPSVNAIAEWRTFARTMATTPGPQTPDHFQSAGVDEGRRDFLSEESYHSARISANLLAGRQGVRQRANLRFGAGEIRIWKPAVSQKVVHDVRGRVLQHSKTRQVLEPQIAIMIDLRACNP